MGETQTAKIGDWVKVVAEDDEFSLAIGKVINLVEDGLEILIIFYDDADLDECFREKYAWRFETVGHDKGIKAVYEGRFLQPIDVEE